jgi:C4-dicarboxylate transporter DctM subunit
MTPTILALILVALVVALLFFRQPLIVILLGVCAYVQFVWGKGQFDYIIEDMWVGLDKELILSIPLFILCGSQAFDRHHGGHYASSARWFGGIGHP